MVLLVDDEEDILISMEALLATELKDVDVRVASSGRQALEILKQGPVSLIVTDYRMPGMDGLQFLAEARKLQPGVPSMMVTAYPDPELAARAARQFGVGLFIAKPFDLGYFVQVVNAFVHRKLPPASVPPEASHESVGAESPGY